MNQRDKTYATWGALAGSVFLIVAAVLEYWPTSSFLDWKGLDEARTLAVAQNRPIFVDVYANWCEPCKMMDKNVFPDDSVQLVLKTRFIPARVNGDEPVIGDSLRKKLGIRAYPTYIVLSPTGRERKRRIGFIPRDALLRWLNDSTGVQILTWPDMDLAFQSAQAQRRRVMVLVLQSGEDLESANTAFENEKTGEVVGKYFVPTLLVKGNLEEEQHLEAVGATPKTTMPEIIVLESNRKEVGRFFITPEMEYSRLAVADKLSELAAR